MENTERMVRIGSICVSVLRICRTKFRNFEVWTEKYVLKLFTEMDIIIHCRGKLRCRRNSQFNK